MDHSGHTALDTQELGTEEVKRQFDELVQKGYLAYTVDEAGQGEQVRSFPEDATRVVVHAPMQGG